MTSNSEIIHEVSTNFLLTFGEFEIPRPWIWIRFIRLRFKRHPVSIVPLLSEDYLILRTMQTALKESKEKKNRPKILVFENMKRYRFLSKRQLDRIADKDMLALFRKIEVFLAIYQLEINIAQSVVPFVELADELDLIIEAFQKSQIKGLLRKLGQLGRKMQRRRLQALASGVLAIVSLLLLRPIGEFGQLITVGLLAIPYAIVFLAVWTAIGMWRQFPPLIWPETD